MVRISTQVVRRKKHNISRVIMLPSTQAGVRNSLQNQMGSNYVETRNFVTRIKQSLKHVAALWVAALTDAGAEGRPHESIKKGTPPVIRRKAAQESP